MPGILNATAAFKSAAVSSITTTGTWAGSGSTSPVVSATRTLTVPGGNPGDLKFAIALITGTPTMQYQKNGGTFTTFTNNQVINFADSDTLAIRASSMLSGDEVTVTVTDNTTAAILSNAGDFSRS